MNKPLIAIVGPTATGKSDLGIEIAKKYGGEIISADSWLIRRDLNIGTAKPSIADQRGVPHYMIDLVTPEEDYSAARYKKEASEVIKSIDEKNKLPIVVGGTGLYVDALLYDYSFLPASTPDVRERLNAMSLSELHQLATEKGLDLCSVDVNNKRRVIRLIETDGMVATRNRLRPNTLIIGLRAERDQLKKNISKRVDLMFRNGLESEVKKLVSLYGWDCEGLKGIGYSEWRLFFNGNQSIDMTRERIIKDTYELAKRQQTWFKRNKSIHWFTTPVKLQEIDDLITTFLSKNIFI